MLIEKFSVFRRLAVLSSSGLALAAATLAGSQAHAAAPTVVIASAPSVDPAAALTYYGSPVSPAAATTRDPAVAELARALNYDVDRIFEYTRDNIEFLPMFGLLKGSRGVALDSYGTAFDQAQFMVDSLREADAVAGKGYSPSYVLGRITLSSAQFAAWTGITDAAAATKYLANGGIPGTVTGTGSTFSVAMMHVWVSVTIGGTTYLFDPSQKASTSQAGLNWQATTGYSKPALLAAAGGTQSAGTIADFNSTQFRTTLNTYRSNLEAYIETNAAGKRADAVVGTTTIVPHPSSEDRRTTLPYVTSSDRVWGGEIPNQFRTSITVSLNSSAYGTYYSDAVGGKVLGFSYVGSGATFAKGSELPQPVISSLVLDECDDYLGNRPAASPAATVNVSINHPYSANSGTYADRTISRTVARQQCSEGRFFVSNDWGYVGPGTASRLAPVASAIRVDPSRANEFVFAPTLANVASQYSALLDLSAKAQGNVFQMHDLVGIHTVDNVRTKLASGNTSYDLATYLSMSFEGAVSAFAKTNTAPANTSAAYIAGMGLAVVEAAVPRQEADSVYDMAGLNLISQQNARAITAGNYSTRFATTSQWSSTRSSISANYPATAITALNGYNTEGYYLLVPQFGKLRQPPITVASIATRTASLWEGWNTLGDGGELNRSAFVAIRPSSGAGSIPDRITVGVYDQRRGSVVKAGLGVAMATGAANDPIRKPEVPKAEGKDLIRAALNVDGRTGAVTYAPATDLTDGIGEFPRSVELKRVFDSRDQTNYGFGVGWKSNWYQTVTYSNDGQAALGRSGAYGVASALVMLQAMSDLVQTQDARGIYPAVEVASWFADTTINNTAVVNRGLDNEVTFYRKAAGSYANGRPDGGTLTVSGAPETGIINRRLYRGMAATYTDAAGSVRTYSPAGDGTGYDLSSPGLSALFARKTQYMKTWNFLNGLKVNAEYNSSVAAPDVIYLQRAYNNLGNAIYVSHYDYGSSTDIPVCRTPGGTVDYDPPRPAEIRYRSASGEVRYGMDAQLGWALVGDPDTARCAPGSTTPSRRQLPAMSGLNGFSDTSGAAWNYGYTVVNTQFGQVKGLGSVYKPTSATPAITITYGLDGNARSLTNLLNNSWVYRSSPFRSEVRSPLQETAGGPGSVTYFDRYAQPVRSTDPLLRTTTTLYDGLGRPIEVTRPEGDKTLTSYDARGNVLTETLRPKPGSGKPDLTSTTAYAAGPTVLTCTTFATCNKPLSVVDARNFRTNYTWNSTTGEPLSIASGYDGATGLTCQLTGGTCPLTSFSYTAVPSYDPYAGTSSGNLTLLTGKTVAIQSGSSATTNYTYVTRDYSPAQYTGMSINPVRKIEVSTILNDSGGLNLRTCFAYDMAGNIISVTDPKEGQAPCP